MREPASGAVEGDAHLFALRVYYEDTDAAGIVYHANYLRFAERARSEWLRLVGFDHQRLRREFGCTFTVRRCLVDYRAPAHLDDALVVRTRLVGHGGARLELVQEVLRGEAVLARLELALALLGAGLRPSRLPKPLLAALAGQGA